VVAQRAFERGAHRHTNISGWDGERGREVITEQRDERRRRARGMSKPEGTPFDAPRHRQRIQQRSSGECGGFFGREVWAEAGLRHSGGGRFRQHDQYAAWMHRVWHSTSLDQRKTIAALYARFARDRMESAKGDP
jgi:hypothetical protein